MGRIRNPEPALSGREIQLLELLATGLGNRAIAKQLFISEATVKTHLVHIYGKLGVDNRTAAISVASAAPDHPAQLKAGSADRMA